MCDSSFALALHGLDAWKGRSVMFGRMMVEPIVQVAPSSVPQTAVATLVKAADNVEIVRWIEFPNSLLLFVCRACSITWRCKSST